MISNLFVSNINRILNGSDLGKDKFDLEIEKDIYSEDEKKLIYYLREIDNKLHNYSYNKNPYSFLNNIEVQKSDIEFIVNLIEDDELKAKVYDFLWVNYKNYRGAQEAYRIFTKLINKAEVDSEDKFHYIFRIFDIYVSTGKKEVIKISEDSLTALLFPTVVLDKRGKIKFKLPSISPQCKEEAILANAEAEYLNYASLYTQVYINPILLYIHNNFKVDEEILKKIVEDNFFIPCDRKKSFVKGLLAGFEFDLITSLSILIPQVENALRCLAEQCGDVIYKSNEDGVEELITLNGILDLPKLNETLEDDLIFNLKSIFTSKFGINIRNEIAHGIIDDEEFKSVYALYVWWFILKLCCIYSPWIMFREK